MPQLVDDPVRQPQLEAELAGLDELELEFTRGPSRARRVWSVTWPKLLAVAIALFAWQLVVWSGWKPESRLPAPATVFKALWEELTDGNMLKALGMTLKRAAIGFSMALVIGTILGVAVARVPILRNAMGSLITGLQTMPSIAWFPLAILLFGLEDSAVYFVVVLGAAPSIANGIITGIDHIPPILLRAGKSLGARGWASYRHVILPAALPGFVGGLKQGWAFSWRSLMAGELLVPIAGATSLGFKLQYAREFLRADELLATMVVILAVGIILDAVVFGRLDRAVRRRWGLLEGG